MIDAMNAEFINGGAKQLPTSSGSAEPPAPCLTPLVVSAGTTMFETK
jgi:hypothetical protein